MADENKFDGILMSIIQQKGNIDGFFDTVFGFLRRNTDFFANQKKAEESIVNNCKKNFDKYTADQNEKKKQQEKRKEAEEKKKKAREQQERKLKEAQQEKPKVEEPKVESTQKKQQSKETDGKKESKEQDNTPPPIGNGGRTEKYIWTQTLENLDMYIPIAKEITKKQVKVTIGLDSLKVIVNGQTIIDGKFKDKINVDDTIWTIEDGQVQDYKGKYININIQKWKNQTSWWSTPIQGDKEINTQKINPEPSKLSDLDGETRSTVEKMMFDMRQKQAGLPTSDQLQKQQKMKEFMKAHPEMDFSQCKFN